VTVSDDQDPYVTCPSDQFVSADNNCEFTMADYTALVISSDNCDLTLDIDQSPVAGTIVAGTSTVTMTITDDAGNVTTCTFSVIVEDNTAPTIVTCANDVTEQVGASCSFTMPSYTGLVLATDNCDPNLTYTQSPVAGTILFGFGTTQLVTITVTDDNGNSTDCSFVITLDDSINPSITCPANLTVNNDLDACSAMVNVPAPSVADNCIVASVVNNYTATANASGVYPVGTTTVLWTVTDIAGNTAQCSITITVVDNQDPYLTCPTSVTQTADASLCEAAVSVNAAVVSDNCGILSVVNNYNGTANASDVYPVGTTSVLWTITDIHGNVSTCTMSVTVSDDENPSITCPSNITVSNDNNACDADVTVPAPVVADNCAVGSVINNYNGTANATDNYPVGTTTVLWTVTDIHGNVSTCVMDITVIDDEAPSLTCPSNIFVGTDTDVCQAAVVVPAPVVSDECGILSVVNDFTGTNNASGVYPIGTTTVLWTLTDIHGNVSTCTMTVTVSDDQDPYVTCPSDITVNNDTNLCGAQITVPQPVVSDNCGIASLLNDYNNTDNATDFYNVGNTTILWTITDVHGNVSICTMNITVLDNENPSITCPADITVTNDNNACNANIAIPQPAIADNCLVATLVNDYNGSDNASDNYIVGTTIVTWTVIDVYGNSSTCTMNITVVDDEAPEVNCANDITVNNGPTVCESLVNIDLPIVGDECGILSIVNDYNGIDNASGVYPVGTTTVNWTITDIHGNSSFCSTIITVIDNENPSITCPLNITVLNDTGSCDALVTIASPATNDNCGVAFATNDYNNTSDATDTYPVGTTTVIWTVTDIYGNSSSCSMTITVVDPELPTITCAADIIQTADSGVCEALVSVPSPTVNDNCSIASVVNNYNGTSDATDTYLVGTTSITWTVTDIYGNQSTCTQSITVTDNENPTISCPANISVNTDLGMCSALVAIGAPSVTDNCTVANFVNNYNNSDNASDVYPEGSTIITWTVTDIHGNSSTCDQTIIVSDNEDPIVSCVPDINQNTDTNVCEAFVVVPAPTVTDNCGISTITNDYTGNESADAIYPQGSTTVVWTIEDIHGNISTCSTTITVNDDENPMITCPASITQTADFGVCEATVIVDAAIVSDNCTVSSVINDYNNTDNASDIYPVGTTTIVWTVTDIHGNQSNCLMAVTITDNEVPSISCPADIAVSNDSNNCDANVIVPAPTTDDNCAVATTINNYNGTSNATDNYPVGTTVIEWTVTDIHGNESNCTMTVTVLDDEAPEITCPTDITIGTDNDVCEALVNVPSIIVSDECGISSITNDYTGTPDASAIYPIGNTSINWTVIDIYGNTSNCTMTITVVDDQVPNVTCPVDITANNDLDECGATIVVPQPIVLDNCGILSFVNDYNGTSNASAYYSVGSTQVLWTITDIHGNISTCTMNINVVDPENPNITCPSNITISNDLDQCSANVVVPQPIVTDNCSVASFFNDYNGTNSATDNYPVGATTITWTVADIYGNTSTCSMTVTVVDDEAPEVTCPTDIAVDNDLAVCEALVTVNLPTVSDECGIQSIVNDYNGTDNASDVYPVGNTTVIWTITDIHGNESTCSTSITVFDNELPTIICPADIAVINNLGACEALVTVQSPTISDNCEVLSLTNDHTGTDDASGIFLVGSTTVVWTLTDIHGNVNNCSMVVTVNDTEIPSILCPANITVTNNPGFCGGAVSVASPQVSDNCEVLAFENNFTGTNNASGFYPVGTTVVIWTVTDIHGNINTCEMTVTVTDIELPVIDCPENVSVNNDEGECGAFISIGLPEAVDNCSISTLSNSFTGTEDASAFYPSGSTLVTWTAVDASGNSTQCSIIVTVTDAEEPTITTCTEDVVVSNDQDLCGAIVTYDIPVVTDNCIIVDTTIIQGFGSGGLFPIGTTLVVYEYTDANGNTASCSFNVTVEDTQLPEIICPLDIQVNNDLGMCGANVNYTLPQYSDNCGTGTLTLISGPAQGEYFAVGTTEVTYQVTDEEGNTFDCTFNVTVFDVEAPVIDCPENITQVDPIVNYNLPVYADNCSATIQLIEGLESGDVFPHGYTTVIFVATDLAGNTDTCSFVILVNTPPVAVDDFAEYLEEDDVITIDVILNDYDLDGDSIFVTDTWAQYGTVSIGPDNTLLYEALEGWCGQDTVTYVLSDEYFATDTAIVIIDIECFVDLIIPQGISPNGDGINDFFEIIGLEDYPRNKLSVFNRWGHKVYQQESYRNEWDGKSESPLTLGSGLLPKGTYFYVLDLGPDQKAIKGYVFLNY